MVTSNFNSKLDLFDKDMETSYGGNNGNPTYARCFFCHKSWRVEELKTVDFQLFPNAEIRKQYICQDCRNLMKARGYLEEPKNLGIS